MEMIIIIVWLALSIAVANVAMSKNRSGISWFLFAVVFSPVLAILFLIAMPVRETKKKASNPFGYGVVAVRKQRNFLGLESVSKNWIGDKGKAYRLSEVDANAKAASLNAARQSLDVFYEVDTHQ